MSPDVHAAPVPAPPSPPVPTPGAGAAWRVLEAPVPPDLDHPDAWALHGAEVVSRESDRVLYGHEDLAYSAAYLLARLREQHYARRVRLVAAPAHLGAPTADDVVGTAAVVVPRTSNEHLAMVAVTVRPDARRQGVGTALLQAAEAIARDAGRTTVVLDSEHGHEPPAGTPGVLEPPTGSGRIRADDPGARMARAHGYALEQAERYSVLDLPVDAGLLGRLHADAAQVAGPDYRLVSWEDRAPGRWVDQVALLETRMSTDAPMAALDIQEDVWDAARVRTWEDGVAAAGHGSLTVAAEHVPTGTLAAFTVVEYPRHEPGVVFQEDTLVLREHRGRRLGMLVKSGLLLRLVAVRPDARRVHTWNAEENRFMLAINVALGFRPAGVAGQWQKRLG